MTESEARTIKIDDRDIGISHADKALFPNASLNKYDLANYYARIAPIALRHYRDRALTMHRFPEGIEGEGFFQKQIGNHFPNWIDRATLPKKGGEVTYVVVDSKATLVYLADQGCITPHLSLARIDRPDHPDRMIFDLDPSDNDFSKVRQAAGRLKTILDKIELTTFVQTTGSRGLHLVVPLDRSAGFDTVRDFAHRLCQRAASSASDLLTVEPRKNKRGSRVFLDYLRNAYGQTAVAPYAVRPLPGAPIATPLRWEEVDSRLDPQRYRVDNIFKRLAQTSDPWADISSHTSQLPELSDLPESAS